MRNKILSDGGRMGEGYIWHRIVKTPGIPGRWKRSLWWILMSLVGSYKEAMHERWIGSYYKGLICQGKEFWFCLGVREHPRIVFQTWQEP